jgi:hypothetical protein
MKVMRLACLLAATLVFGAANLAAQTLYKLVDKNGKVTYAEKVPPNYDGKVTRMDIDPNANTATLPKAPAPKGEGEARGNAESLREGLDKRAKAEERVLSARERLEEANKALEEARKNPGEGDLQWIGNVGGGARAINTPQYTERLERLEAAVRAAEQDLKRTERGAP